MGCTVIEGHARFIDDRTIEAAGKIVRARRFVVATGSGAPIPSIAGLDGGPYFTNETIFENRVLPGHLLVIAPGRSVARWRRRTGGLARKCRCSTSARCCPRTIRRRRRSFAVL